MKTLKKKSITLSIILLFIGVSFSSGISLDTKSTSVDDCDCNEVDDKHILFLEKQLNRLEVYYNLFLVLNKYNPELEEMREELPKEIATIKEKLTSDKDTFICEILNIYDSIIEIIFIKYDIYRDYFIDNGNHLIVALLGIYLDILNYLHVLIWDNGYYLDCDWIPPWYIPQFIE